MAVIGMRKIILPALAALIGLIEPIPVRAEQKTYGLEIHTIEGLNQSLRQMMDVRLPALNEVSQKWQSLFRELRQLSDLVSQMPQVKEVPAVSDSLQGVLTDTVRARSDFSFWSQKVSLKLILIESSLAEIDQVILRLDQSWKISLPLHRAHAEASATVRGRLKRMKRRFKTLAAEINFRVEVIEKTLLLATEEKRHQAEQKVIDQVRGDLDFRNQSFFFRDIVSRLETKLDFQLSVVKNLRKAEELGVGLEWMRSFALPVLRASAVGGEQLAAIRLLEADLETARRHISDLSKNSKSAPEDSLNRTSEFEESFESSAFYAQQACASTINKSRVNLVPYLGDREVSARPFHFSQDRNGVSVGTSKISGNLEIENDYFSALNRILDFSAQKTASDEFAISKLLVMVEETLADERNSGRSGDTEWAQLLTFRDRVQALKASHQQALRALEGEAGGLRTALDDGQKVTGAVAADLSDHSYAFGLESLEEVIRLGESEIRKNNEAIVAAARDVAFGASTPNLRDLLLFGSRVIQGTSGEERSQRYLYESILGLAVITDLLDLSGAKGRSLRTLAEEARLGKLTAEQLVQAVVALSNSGS